MPHEKIILAPRLRVTLRSYIFQKVTRASGSGRRGVYVTGLQASHVDHQSLRYASSECCETAEQHGDAIDGVDQCSGRMWSAYWSGIVACSGVIWPAGNNAADTIRVSIDKPHDGQWRPARNTLPTASHSTLTHKRVTYSNLPRSCYFAHRCSFILFWFHRSYYFLICCIEFAVFCRNRHCLRL